MGLLGRRALFETIRTLDSAGFDTTFQKVGTPLAHPSALLYILNGSGVIIQVSDDGTNSKFAIAAGGFLLLDIGSDSQGIEDRLTISQGTQIYVSGAASTGLVYLSTMYQGG